MNQSFLRHPEADKNKNKHMSPTTAADEQMETLSRPIKRIICEGAPLFNQGQQKACYKICVDAALWACTSEKMSKTLVGEILERSVGEARAIVHDPNNNNDEPRN